MGTPGAVLPRPRSGVVAEQVLHRAGDERELHARDRRFPEGRVQSRHELVEPLELGHPSSVAERERRQVGHAADQAELPISEEPVTVPADDGDRAGSVRLPRHGRDQHLPWLLRDEVVALHQR